MDNIKLLHITTHSDNTKMEGLKSLSTSTRINENCRRNAQVKGSICEKCYAETYLKLRHNLDKNTEENSDLLSSSILDDRFLPVIWDRFFRFEAFGDLINETHFINYCNICRKNPDTTFAIWTKCPWIIKQAIASGCEKPDNLVIIASSLMINTPLDINLYDFVDRVFTVYTADYAIANNVNINCGSRKCPECLKCYRKSDNTQYINEMLKSDAKKYYSLINQ